MKKLFFRWKDESCNGIKPEWVEMTGKEFIEFKRNPENKHRKFAEYIDEYQESATIVMEVTQDSYNRWHCEDVIRRRKRTERYVAGYKEISMDEEICGQNIEDFTLHDVIADESVDVEKDVINLCEINHLREIFKKLSPEEMELIEALYLSENPMTERDYAKKIGLCHSGLHKRKIMVLKKIKKFF
ncbi:MAG: hypothetical protein IKJ59_07015 [Clostridia bacterium]|nr:hypothetical protein [Clostridia bacterium]